MKREGGVDAGQELECFISHLDGRAEVLVRGVIDMATAAQFAAAVDDAMAESQHLVFDMGDVTFLDSSGVAVLAVAAQRVLGTGSITVRHAPPRVSRLLAITGIDDLVTSEAAEHRPQSRDW